MEELKKIIRVYDTDVIDGCSFIANEAKRLGIKKLLGVKTGGIYPTIYVRQILDLGIDDTHYIGAKHYGKNGRRLNNVHFYDEPDYGELKDGKLLVVDGVVESGGTFSKINEILLENNITNFKKAALLLKIKDDCDKEELLKKLGRDIIFFKEIYTNKYVLFENELEGFEPRPFMEEEFIKAMGNRALINK